MYQYASAPLGAAAMLPFTGFEPLWMVLGGIALFAAGGALRRIAPKTEA